MRQRQQGFTLIEMAVAVFIIALLLGSILVPLTTQVEQRQIADTQKLMEEIKEALLGFAAANGYLPCPDTTGDGVADPAVPGVCPNVAGFVPWATLNVARGDTWGNRFRYRVTSEFTNTPVAGTCVVNDTRIGLCDAGNINVNTPNPVTKAVQTLAINVVAVILSHGRNGYGAVSTAGTAQPAAPGINADEITNANVATGGAGAFVSRPLTPSTTTCSDTVAGQPFCEFDDIVTWVSPFTLFNRMVAAGRLP